MGNFFQTWTGRWTLLFIGCFLGGILTIAAWGINKDIGHAIGAGVLVFEIAGLVVLLGCAIDSP